MNLTMIIYIFDYSKFLQYVIIIKSDIQVNNKCWILVMNFST